MNKATPKSLLFVPATRPERFEKAASCGATLVIDLEDTVHADDKDTARLSVIEFDTKATTPYWVRVGADPTDDVRTLKSCRNLAGVLLPKAEDGKQITQLADTLGLAVIAVIETAYAMANVSDLAGSSGLFALSFGRLDLGRQLGAALGSRSAEILFDRLRADMVVYSGVYGLARPIETVFIDFKDRDGLIKTATHAYQMGFGGQLCIHPTQVPIVNTCYLPSDGQLAFAKAILRQHEATGEMAFAIDGVMVDLPLIDWAKTLNKPHSDLL